VTKKLEIDQMSYRQEETSWCSATTQAVWRRPIGRPHVVCARKLTSAWPLF